MMVARALRRNTKITSTTSTTASVSSNSTSSTEARMVTVRSLNTDTSIAAGNAAVSCGSSFLTVSTTAMTLAPGWRCTLRITAGDMFIQAASLSFWAPSTAVATSLSMTADPLR